MRRVAIEVRGVVQGVGFRPFVYRLANAQGIAGFVRNDTDAVRIEAEGDDLDAFLTALREGGPGAVRSIDVRELAAHGERGFSILESRRDGDHAMTIPADLAPCAECLAEIADPAARRYRYPFTNCTQCGPRYTIVEALPYDRAHTTMRAFAMCEDCTREYRDPLDRRYHAEPIACPRCGPTLQGDLAAIAEGKIVALKGVGGYQLLCDARNEAAVQRLRARKRRPAKPFAVMFPSLDELRAHAFVDDDAAAALLSRAAPIVLVRGRGTLAPAVAPTTRFIGAMLPSSPLHKLLVHVPVVCTSGNLSEEPIATDDRDARERLGTIADVFVTHDRPIARAVDDSVVRPGQVLRRARGLAPVPLARRGGPTVLALGAHLKSTIALGHGDAYVVSQHLGDLDTVASRALFEATIRDLCAFLGAEPEVVACDLHPEYASTLFAHELSIPIERVQHHHAHIAACMAEHALEGPVLGLAWDGSGLGDDGTIWGGEVLLCEGARAKRVAHLRPFALPGGDAAAREPRRSALAVLHAIYGDRAFKLLPRFTAQEERVLSTLLPTSPRTSSMGRLFDAVASILGLRDRCTFEGEAAMMLEEAAGDVACDPYATFPSEPRAKASGPRIIDWEPLIRAIVEDRDRGEDLAVISARFHESLAAIASAIAEGTHTVVLTGGCFQNLRLATRVRERLERAGHVVYSPREYPPNDGGIALGQAFVATERWKERA